MAMFFQLDALVLKFPLLIDKLLFFSESSSSEQGS